MSSCVKKAKNVVLFIRYVTICKITHCNEKTAFTYVHTFTYLCTRKPEVNYAVVKNTLMALSLPLLKPEFPPLRRCWCCCLLLGAVPLCAPMEWLATDSNCSKRDAQTGYHRV